MATTETKAKQAPAIFLVGSTGAGKSSQVCTLVDCKGLKPVVACYDPGSQQAYRVRGLEMADTRKLPTVQDFLLAYPAEKYIRVIDSWPGYESFTAMRLKPSGKAWQKVVGGWRDDIHVSYASSNVILVGNLTDGEKTVQGLDDEGKRAPVVIKRGALVCTPALQQPPLLAQSAPVVLCLSSGGDRFPRGWVVGGQLGQVAGKYSALRDGQPTYLLPGAEPGQRIVPVDVCPLSAIFDSLCF